MRFPCVLVLGLVACASPTQEGADAGTADGKLSLGAAASGQGHHEVSNGGAVRLVEGPQGGHHVWLSLRVGDVGVDENTRGLVVRYALRDSNRSLGQGRSYVSLTSVDGAFEDDGIPMLLQQDVEPSAWTEHAVQVAVDLVSREGTVLATAEREWRVGCCDVWSPGGQGGVDAGFIATLPQDCTTYCDVQMSYCAENEQRMHATSEECQSACALFPETGLPGETSGNTLQCRIHYVGLVASDPRYCGHLAEYFGFYCRDDCAHYCRVMAAQCDAFPTTQECLNACDAYPRVGQRGDPPSDTLVCRTERAEAGDCASALADSPVCRRPDAGR
ncbi:MAG: hypothetical protein AB2A00_07820 [Myxococcota bacterium]